MTLPYNTTNITDARNLADMVTAVNEVSGGLYTNLLILALFIVILAIGHNFPMKKVMIADSFICMIAAGLAWGMGWMEFNNLLILVAIGLGSMAFFIFQKD